MSWRNRLVEERHWVLRAVLRAVKVVLAASV
jgi:hypothetical protein